MMKKSVNQNLLDFLTGSYGSVSFLYQFVKDNNISDIKDFEDFETGTTLTVTDTRSTTVDYFKLKRTYPATGYIDIFPVVIPPPPTWLYPALNITSTSIYFQYQGSSAATWRTVENIAPYQGSGVLYPVAVFSMDIVNRRVTVVTPGYSCGFIIKDASGNIIVEVPAVEGVGPFGQNNVLHNILSTAGNSYSDHFTITNSVLSTIWVNDIPRLSDPYALGYSLETLGNNAVQNSTCNDFPRVTSYLALNGCTATIVSGQLSTVFTSNLALYSLGRGSGLEYLPPNFYKAVVDVVSISGGLEARMFFGEVNVAVGGDYRTSTPGTHTFYRNATVPNDTKNFQLRASAAGTVVWDNIYIYPVTNRLFFGVKRPPHAILAGKDASNFNITNPA